MTATQLEHENVLVDPGPPRIFPVRDVSSGPDQHHRCFGSIHLSNGIRTPCSAASASGGVFSIDELEEAGSLLIGRSDGEVVSTAICHQETHGLRIKVFQLALIAWPLVSFARFSVQRRNSGPAGTGC